MNTLLETIITQAQTIPRAAQVVRQLLQDKSMTACKQIAAALRQITDTETYGFYVAEEYVLIERLIELTERPFNSDSYAEVKSKLHGAVFDRHLGIEITKTGDFLTVWGPGVKRG